MKKVLITMTILVGLTAFAQRGEHRKALQEMTPEQVATLHTKKMALTLDLDENQQQQVMEINVANAEFQKARMEERKALKESGEFDPSSEEKFEWMNARLDQKLAVQEQYKAIFTDEQYAQWKKMSHRKHMHGKKKMQRRSERE
ncbi:hypothetical protein [Allomuricauda sp. d1]|uniref:hypothetical protein n=1 Tax=Allomuricauda sp. d1 TaxID=3136725 RepID=UPI0031CE84F2